MGPYLYWMINFNQKVKWFSRLYCIDLFMTMAFWDLETNPLFSDIDLFTFVVIRFGAYFVFATTILKWWGDFEESTIVNISLLLLNVVYLLTIVSNVLVIIGSIL